MQVYDSKGKPLFEIPKGVSPENAISLYLEKIYGEIHRSSINVVEDGVFLNRCDLFSIHPTRLQILFSTASKDYDIEMYYEDIKGYSW